MVRRRVVLGVVGRRGVLLGRRPAHLLVVGLVLGEDLLPEFLFALVDIRVKLVPVLADRKLLVVVDGNVDLLRAHWLLVWVVELSHVGVLQGLLGCQSLVRVKLKKVPKHVQGIIGGGGEHVAQLLWLRGRKTLQHRLGEG